MNFWKYERKLRLKELKYIMKAQRAAFRQEKKYLRHKYRVEKRIKNSCQCFSCQRKHMVWGLLFGVMLILWGISHITETIFNIHIPVFGIIFGLFLLYLGIQLIMGFRDWPKSCCSRSSETNFCRTTCMGSSHIIIDKTLATQEKSPLDFKTIMGKSIIDLTNLDSETIRARGMQLIVHVDTALGKTRLVLNKTIPTRIIANGACAKVTTPDENITVFGSHTFNNHTHEQPLLVIYSSTICGETKITFE